MKNAKILIRGTVQGVGFRPFIYNLAKRFQILGNVTNCDDGVVIFASAPSSRLEQFIAAITDEKPPLARITGISQDELNDETQYDDFTILASTSSGKATTAIPPDISLCDDCLRELFDPTDRRYLYPFINCTNCGPRFTLVHTIPYDRPKTSMKAFALCELCKEEYHDPANRRFHAQPNACPDCGPQIWFQKGGATAENEYIYNQAAIDTCIKMLASGGVVAIRGIGGFHLVVNGCDEQAVATLRERKNRPAKPLAIMCRDLETVEKFCTISGKEQELLLSLEHPIVLLHRCEQTATGCTDSKRDHAPGLAANLAPNISEIGVMLPYSPLHHLLLRHPDCPAALVMTSGNISGTPICTGNGDALTRLADIADGFLLHNREIVTRVDDSVVRVVDGRAMILRRARGYVPAPLQLDSTLPALPPIIGCGAGLKNTFTLSRDDNGCTSQHIGDLDSLETYEFYTESVDHLQKLLQLTPEAVACDLHPDYPASRYGRELAEKDNLPVYPVQHHHAHAVAVMAEHGLQGPVLAIVLDGSGLGDDQTVWGGEILRCTLTDYQRLGHLSHLPLIGGDAAAVQPWRMALAMLHAIHGEQGLNEDQLPPSLRTIAADKLSVVRAMLSQGFNCPPTSSCGRLFDAFAGLLGISSQISYEGQAAMELEALACSKAKNDWKKNILPIPHTVFSRFVTKKTGNWEISSEEFGKIALDGLARDEDPAELALDFHRMLIGVIATLTAELAAENGIRQVVLSGGCMQNSLLLSGFFHALESMERAESPRLEVYTGNQLPVNDGAISFGQSITGGLLHVSRHSDESHLGSR